MTDRIVRRGRGGQGGHEPRARIRTRELRATELSALGWSQDRIAADLGISQAAVSKLLKRIEARLFREAIENLAHQKGRQALRLEHQYREAMQSWEASKASATRKRQRKTQGGAGRGEATVAEVVIEDQHGDPRYLEVARRAMADLRKLWGLEAPSQVDVRASNPYGAMTEAELVAAIAEQAQLIQGPFPDESSKSPEPAESPAIPTAVSSQKGSTGDDQS